MSQSSPPADNDVNDRPSRDRPSEDRREPSGLTPLGVGRRLMGLLLILLVALPAFWLLDPGDLRQNLVRTGGQAAYLFTWAGAALCVVLAAAVGRLTRGRVQRLFGALSDALERPPGAAAALGVGLLGAILTVLASHLFFDGRSILNDASVQLVQARYFAAGRLAGPVLEHPEFWSVQFMVLTPAGWVSQYPPAHALVLAGGFLLGAPWVAMGLVSFALGAAAAASFERLLPNRVGLARGAALASVVSPLLLGLSAGYMNHATLAALAACALYLALRAEEGGVAWAVAAGATMGAAVATRPLTGLLIGSVVTLGVWSSSERRSPGWLLRRCGAWVLGGLPFAVGFGLFNQRFFGSPVTLGYLAATGPSHGLGFHEDPWGRYYGPLQAVGNTSAELVALGRDLLGTPFPIVAAVGLFLLLVRRLTRGERLIAAWALLPTLASALYWHHDLVFGPRMLGEAVPAWCALILIAAVALARRGGGGWTSETVAALALTVTVVGIGWGSWTRLGQHARRLGPHPDVEAGGPSLAFVHESWTDRLGARLASRGVRLDSVRTLLGRYHPCQLQAALEGRSPTEMSEQCRREEASDRLGWLGITDLLWLGDLPGIGGTGPMWVRDLGPEANRRLLEAYPDRVPLFALPDRRGDNWRTVPYEMGMERLWSGAGPPSPGEDDGPDP